MELLAFFWKADVGGGQGGRTNQQSQDMPVYPFLFGCRSK
jgi:hypothetical protein